MFQLIIGGRCVPAGTGAVQTLRRLLLHVSGSNSFLPLPLSLSADLVGLKDGFGEVRVGSDTPAKALGSRDTLTKPIVACG